MDLGIREPRVTSPLRASVSSSANRDNKSRHSSLAGICAPGPVKCSAQGSVHAESRQGNGGNGTGNDKNPPSHV